VNPDQSAGVVAPPPLIFVGGLLLGLGLDALLGSSAPGIVRVIGGLLILAGVAFDLAFMAGFRRAGTAVEPWKPTTAIVTDGPYRFTRNPGYLGMALWSSGIALALAAPWALLGVALAIAVVDRGVIAREEQYLQREFGEEYVAYQRRVRRWV
jgi:protein-S-isoprenylcysteine O-methyltransferase Ste14